MSSCQCCNDLKGRPSMPAAANHLMETDLKGLSESQTGGCKFCQLIWDIANSQRSQFDQVPDGNVHVVLSKLYTSDLVLWIYWGKDRTYFDTQITMLLYKDKGNDSTLLCFLDFAMADWRNIYRRQVASNE